MTTSRRRLIVVLLGILLIILPLLIRMMNNGYPGSSYQPPATGLPELAVTPEPTPTALPAVQEEAIPVSELNAGSVIVDLAHFNLVSPAQFQPLAAQLSTHGLSLYFWMNPADIFELDVGGLADLPDQSEELAGLLQDAAGLVVISPVFLWTPAEVDVVEKFVADGGRLLLISDPDIPEVPEYFIHDINKLGQPFGVVFNDDYLYDLSHNDRNYTHFFLAEFLDRAATSLTGRRVAFYGARSISGPVTSQALTADTTLSSLRSGLTSFSAVAIGGLDANDTIGNVLAMGDFDVLTEPYVSRHHNRLMLEFVAGFLAHALRTQLLDDFPAYLGTDVSLAFGEGTLVDAKLLAQSSSLQTQLEETGRVLTLAPSTDPLLTSILAVARTATITVTPAATAIVADSTPQDLIYLGSYETAIQETTLLTDVGISLVEQVETPEPSPDAGDVDQPAEGEEDAPTPTATVQPSETGTPEATATVTPTPEPTPELTSTLILDVGFGPRLLAAETIVILRDQQPGSSQVTAVLGQDADAVSAGLNRLLSRDFGDCVRYPDLALCPFVSGETDVSLPSEPPDTEVDGEEPIDVPEAAVPILIIDDDKMAAAGDEIEADIYLGALAEVGYWPDLWTTADSGSPGQDDLEGYDWVIWSNGVYQESSLDVDTFLILLDYVDLGGQLTISGRHLPPGVSQADPSVIADVVKTDSLPEMVAGLPDEPIELASDLPPVVPLESDVGEDALVVLRRGPKSDDADAPLMVILTDGEATGSAQPSVAVLAMPLNWLPYENAYQLVQNMAFWLMAE
jgi:hypothetical protein